VLCGKRKLKTTKKEKHTVKATFLLRAVQNGAKRIPMGLVVAAAIFLRFDATAIPTVNLGTDSSFAVLAGSGITVAGAVNSTTITGDIGTFPTTSITGFGNVVLNGANHAGDAVTQGAKNDLVIAYLDASGRIATTSYGPIFDLGGLMLTTGVYHGSTSFGITGTLTLDAQGNPDAVWIFQAGSTLTTASSSRVALINGAQACHVFWEIGSSATLGTDSEFVGNLLALQSITADTGATVDGRLLAQNGAVTLDNNTITKSVCTTTGGGAVPDSGSTLLLLSSGLATLLAFGRRFSSPA
jgi:hypothetical protein